MELTIEIMQEITLTQQSIVQILQSIPLFSGIGDKKVYNSLAEICTGRTYAEGEKILSQSDETNHALVIYKGAVRVYRTASDHETITLALLGKGDIVGELGLLDGGKRSATIEAIEPVELLEIHHDDFIEFLKAHPTVAVEVVKLLVRRLRATSQLTEEIHTAKLTTRTLNTLQNLSRLHDNTRTVTISQEELARIIGASRPRVTEALQDLERSGKISRKWRSITLQ